jgi:hypothetical protein
MKSDRRPYLITYCQDSRPKTLLFQGRVPRSLFARNYFRSDFKNDGRIINSLNDQF